MSGVQIGRDRRSASLWIGHGHIAVRSYEIERVPLEATPTHRGAPRKHAQPYLTSLTRAGHSCRSLSVHVDLPVEGREWREVVDLVWESGHPRQTVPTMHITGAP